MVLDMYATPTTAAELRQRFFFIMVSPREIQYLRACISFKKPLDYMTQSKYNIIYIRKKEFMLILAKHKT